MAAVQVFAAPLRRVGSLIKTAALRSGWLLPIHDDVVTCGFSWPAVARLNPGLEIGFHRKADVDQLPTGHDLAVFPLMPDDHTALVRLVLIRPGT